MKGEFMPQVIAVIPALNEAETIGGVVRALATDTLAATLAAIIVVDNGSTDDTAACATAAGALVVSEPARGYGAACAAGVARAGELGAEIIVLLDGDASDHPADLRAILAPVLSGDAEFVMGSRTRGQVERGALTGAQRFGNALAARLLGLLGLTITDLGPFRAIRTASLAALDMHERTYGWSTEMLVKAARLKLRFREVPVTYRRRGGGRSKVSGTVRGSVRAGVVILGTVLRYARWQPARPMLYRKEQTP